MPEGLIDRLLLTESRDEGMAEGLARLQPWMILSGK